MAQRPSFDLSKVSTADKILGVGSLLLFIDTLFNWQTGTNAWGGNGAFAGILMALFTLLLFIAVALTVAEVEMPQGVPVRSVTAWLTAGTVLFGIIKFLFAVTNAVAWAAWTGLILILVIAYGGYMKMQEAKAISSEPDSGFTA
jgi:cellobiose-specific phosphotransferase system component IIC